MLIEKPCKHCKKMMTPHAKEGRPAFKTRQFCCLGCSIKHRRISRWGKMLDMRRHPVKADPK